MKAGAEGQRPARRIDLDALDADKLGRMLALYEGLSAASMEANDQMLAMLAAEPGFTPGQAAILNAWSIVNTKLHERHAAAVERLLATLN